MAFHNGTRASFSFISDSIWNLNCSFLLIIILIPFQKELSLIVCLKQTESANRITAYRLIMLINHAIDHV